MNKNLIAIGVVILLLAVAFSGCDEPSQDDVNVEVVSYSVDSFEGVIKIGEGFNHSDNVDKYIIYGLVKNNEGRLLDVVSVIAYFYDGVGNLIYETFTKIYNISNTYEEDFSIGLDKSETNHFHTIESVSFFCSYR